MSTSSSGSHGSPAWLAERLRQLVREHVECFVERHAPGFALPSVFAGHPVGADVRADLAFTLAQLADAGVHEVAGTPVDHAIATVLGGVAGEATHTFWSYRVAETLRRFGPIDDNRLLHSASADRRHELVAACDSISWIGLLGKGLPANYAAVLARCELARQDLGIEVEGATLDMLLERCADLLRVNPRGYLDDSEDRAGCRYDVYTVDLYLFTEPFAARLEPWWTRGARTAVDLVERVGARDGAALAWGRSLGCLAHCHTIELAALALERGLTDEPAAWLVRARRALSTFEASTDGALVDAHRTRGQNRYRGPDRWLQLTFDCLGKLAWAAGRLRRQDEPATRATVRDAYPHRDELIWFDRERLAAVWSFRSHANAFVVPFVGPAWSDYLPAPREPGRYEVPVDAPLPGAVPVVTSGGHRFTGGGLPTQLEHRTGSVTATWARFPPVTPREGHPALDGRRETTYAVDRHVLHVRERLELGAVPEAVSISLAEADGRPLRVEAQASSGARVDVVVTRGLPEYRSFWGELPRVHQIDVEPAKDLAIEWSVRPLLRVATADPTHHYHRSLYDPLEHEVTESTFGAHLVDRPDEALRRLRRVDVFHLHWPEWFIVEVERARRFVALLAEAETMLVWTQHNLVPHRDLSGAHELYQVFADAADVVVHHSEWGRAAVTERYRFGDHARHVVIPHGHFGPLFDAAPPDRTRAFEELGLSPDKLCIAIVGAPRRDKLVQEFMEAFASTDRDDLQLLVLCMEGEAVPDDPRIVARPYEFVPRATYNRWAAVADVIALPFDPAGDMLTTGVVGDVVALGVPAITSHWPYALEALGSAALAYRSRRELVDLLQGLSRDALDAAGAACRSLQPELDWNRLARTFFDELVAAGAFDG